MAEEKEKRDAQAQPQRLKFIEENGAKIKKLEAHPGNPPPRPQDDTLTCRSKALRSPCSREVCPQHVCGRKRAGNALGKSIVAA